MKRAIVLVALMATSLMVSAQSLTVATGAAGKTPGTYSTIFHQLADRCKDTGLNMAEKPTSGTIENVELLLGNQVNGAFVQPDVLALKNMGMANEMARIKTLVTLHQEQVHILAMAAPKIEGGVSAWGKNVGGKEVVFTNINDLKGRRVAASGGSLATAKVLNQFLELNWQINENYGTTDEVLAAVGKGEVDAAVVVGGAPMAAIKALPKTYKLIEIGESSRDRVKDVYKQKAGLSYSNLSSNTIPSVSMNSLFVVLDYKTAKNVTALAMLRQCFYANLDDIKETSGMHPAWQTIKADEKGSWAWYNLPEVPTQSPVQTKVKK